MNYIHSWVPISNIQLILENFSVNISSYRIHSILKDIEQEYDDSTMNNLNNNSILSMDSTKKNNLHYNVYMMNYRLLIITQNNFQKAINFSDEYHSILSSFHIDKHNIRYCSTDLSPTNKLFAKKEGLITILCFDHIIHNIIKRFDAYYHNQHAIQINELLGYKLCKNTFKIRKNEKYKSDYNIYNQKITTTRFGSEMWEIIDIVTIINYSSTEYSDSFLDIIKLNKEYIMTMYICSFIFRKILKETNKYIDTRQYAEYCYLIYDLAIILSSQSNNIYKIIEFVQNNIVKSIDGVIKTDYEIFDTITSEGIGFSCKIGFEKLSNSILYIYYHHIQGILGQLNIIHEIKGTNRDCERMFSYLTKLLNRSPSIHPIAITSYLKTYYHTNHIMNKIKIKLFLKMN